MGQSSVRPSIFSRVVVKGCKWLGRTVTLLTVARTASSSSILHKINNQHVTPCCSGKLQHQDSWPGYAQHHREFSPIENSNGL